MQDQNIHVTSIINDINTTIQSLYLEAKEDGSGDNIILKTCPYCRDDNWKFYINISQNTVDPATGESRVGYYNCFKCPNKGKHWLNLKTVISGETEIIISKPFKQTALTGVQEKTEKIQEWHTALLTNPDALSYVLNRGISEEYIRRFKLGYTTKQDYKNNPIPYLVIPHFFEHQLMNAKFRTLPPAPKNFIRITGAPSILFNYDNIDVEKSHIYICEGEMDAISLFQAGETNIVGITCGARSFLPEWYELLKDFDTVYIVLDTDIAGQEGAKYIAQRLGLDRCKNLLLPPEIKDLNEYFMSHDLEEFNSLALKAQPFSIDSIYTMGDMLGQLERNMFMTGSVMEGYDLPWPGLANKMGKMVGGDLIYLSAKPGVGKCLDKCSTLISTFGLLSIEEIFKRLGYSTEMDPCIIELNKDKQLDILTLGNKYPITHLTVNGKKPIYAIKTKLGLGLNITDNHPLRILNDNGILDWEKCNKINTDTYTVVDKYRYTGGTKTVSEHDARFIGYLIADGYLLGVNKIHFSNSNIDVISDFKGCVNQIDKTLNICSYTKLDSKGIDHCINNKKFKKEYFKRYGLLSVKSPNKEVPLSIREGNIDIWREFLKAYIECESYISKNNIELSSASNKLLEQVQLMLLGFGIISQRNKKWNSKYNRYYYRLWITGDNVLKYEKQIGVISKSQYNKLNNIVIYLKSLNRNTNLDIIPNQSKNLQRIYEDLNFTSTQFTGMSHKYRVGIRNPSYKTLDQIIQYCDSKKIKHEIIELWRSYEGLYFDKVIKKEYIGKKDTFDIVQPKTHEFTANGIINHNTTLSLNIAYDFAVKKDLPALVFCLEMRPERLAYKVMCLHRKTSDELITHDDICMTRTQLADKPIYFGYAANAKALTKEAVFEVFREARKKYGIELLIFDNIHFLCRSITHTTQEMGAISRSFKLLAEELRIPVIVIAHPKKVDEDKMISSVHMKDSSAMHADADFVLLMHRKKIADATIEGLGDQDDTVLFDPMTLVVVDKARFAPGGVCKLYFEGDKSYFRTPEEWECINGQ